MAALMGEHISVVMYVVTGSINIKGFIITECDALATLFMHNYEVFQGRSLASTNRDPAVTLGYFLDIHSLNGDC